MQLPEVGHIGYIVHDASKHAKNFSEIYGISDFIEYEFVPQKAWCYGIEAFDVKFRIVQLKPESGPKIELVEVISGKETPQFKFIAEHGPNIHHTAYYVEDIAKWYAFYKETKGFVITFEVLVEDLVMGRRRSFFVEKEGVPGTWEISERTKF